MRDYPEHLAGLLSAVGAPCNPGTYATAITYHPNLMVSQVLQGNGLSDVYALDPNAMRRPAAVTVRTAANGVRWTTGPYSYDGAGNVKAIGQSSFSYDRVSRLRTAELFVESASGGSLIFADGFESGDTSCWDPGSCLSGGQMLTQTYSYDPFGNLQSIGGSSARETPTASATNRLSGGSYDASGNLTNWNGNIYAYDPFHMLWDYKTPSDEWIYLYTADDERAWSYKTDNTSLWTLRGLDAKVLREYTTAGGWSVATDSIYRDGALLAAETPQGVRQFHLDHLGTPRLITDDLGTQRAYHTYYPFGEEATAFNQDTIREKFTGHERDLGNPGGAGDDLDYMHARHCSPVTGRFLSADPLFDTNSMLYKPQKWNRYLYVIGNPLKYTLQLHWENP